MAADLSLWKLEDCLALLARTLKTYTEHLNYEILESLNAAFRTNHVTGAVLFRFTDEEWADCLVRNKEHLKIMLAKDFWTTEDLEPLRTAST